MALPFLQTIGLTGNETSLYELLLKLGEVPAGKLITEAKIRRATAYKSLYSLESKHLVTHRDVSKILHFRPEAPTKLLEFAESQHQGFDRAREDLRSILPELTSSFILSVEKPVISSFEGIDGIKKVYEDIIAEKQDILLFRSHYDERLPELSKLLDRQIKKQITSGINTRTITPMAKDTRQTYLKDDAKRLVERHIVTSIDFLLPAQIIVYSTKVAIFSLKQTIIVTIINNRDISDTFRRLFELQWQLTQAEHDRITGEWTRALK